MSRVSIWLYPRNKDVKLRSSHNSLGGTIIDYEGQVRLLEVAQVPSDHLEDFKSIKKFKIFNTNNIWLNLKAVKRVLDNDELSLEIIINNKVGDEISELGEGRREVDCGILGNRSPTAGRALFSSRLPLVLPSSTSSE